MATSQMRSKTFVVLLVCIVVTTILFCYFSDQQPIHTFVTETHKKLSNLRDLKKRVGLSTELTTDKKYLNLLGFSLKPNLYPRQSWSQNSSLPVVVTAITSMDAITVRSFVRSSQQLLSQHAIVIYDLGLGRSELISLKEFCNVTNCTVRTFNYNNYPSHVSDLKLFAFRPIIIQEVLNVAGAVLWLDVNTRLVSAKIKNLFPQAEKSGVIAWSGYSLQPTSALTHHRMFDFFRTDENNFYFHRMASADHLLIYNLEEVHEKLMLPWIQCTLTAECIAPIGAQRGGCRFDKKPLYRYSGCHRYDISALNVVLGIKYDYDYKKYLLNAIGEYFRPVDDLKDDEATPTVQYKHNSSKKVTQKTKGKAKIVRLMKRN